VVCAIMPAELRRIGRWYQDFRPVSDAAVTKILASVPAP
jgi:predicted phosphoribosyltransferase